MVRKPAWEVRGGRAVRRALLVEERPRRIHSVEAAGFGGSGGAQPVERASTARTPEWDRREGPP